MNWDAFTPVQATLGGVLIGLSAAWMLAAHGRIAGISGILGGLLEAPRGSRWRLAFVAGLVVAGAVGGWLSPALLEPGLTRSAPLLVVAGLLVGFGSRLGSGCTSGHGICGVGRLSPRSIVATASFIVSGMLSAWLYRLWGGG